MEISSREKFDRDGYFFVPNAIVDPINLYCPPLSDKEGKRLVGTNNYIKDNKIVYEPVESQVNGSMSRYNHPSYRRAHRLILKLIELMLLILMEN